MTAPAVLLDTAPQFVAVDATISQSKGMRCGRTRGKKRTIGIGAAGDVVGVAVEDVVQPNDVGGEGRDDVQQPVLDIRVIWRICGHLELAVAAKSKRQLQSGKDDKA